MNWTDTPIAIGVGAALAKLFDLALSSYRNKQQVSKDTSEADIKKSEAKYVKVTILPETFVSDPYDGYNKLIGFGGLQSKKGIRKNGRYIVFMQRGKEIWVSDEYKRINYEMHLPTHPYKLKAGDSVVLPVPKWNVLPILPHISNKTYNQIVKIQVEKWKQF